LKGNVQAVRAARCEGSGWKSDVQTRRVEFAEGATDAGEDWKDGKVKLKGQ
jgi:hypothetical protein